MMYKRIYLAGPLTPRGLREDCNGNAAIEYLYNVRDMLRTAHRLIAAGYAVFIPGMDFPLFLVNNLTPEQIYKQGLAFLEVCDAVLCLPYDHEKSTGVIAEITRAKDMGIPIFYTFKELHDANQYVKPVKPAEPVAL
jgi:nucleoside 2-deoxyribosyltransferase